MTDQPEMATSMSSVEIVFLDQDSLPVALPALPFEHQLRHFSRTDRELVLERCLDADIVITNKVGFDATTLSQLPRLKMLAVAATGVNHIDLEACRQASIAVSNVRHYGDDTVAEHAFLLMLALIKNLPAYQRDIRAGAWQQAEQFCHFGAPIRDLQGAELGIVGSGGIGQALAARARAFGMRVWFSERKGAAIIRPGYLSFDQMLSCCDVISLHCPLNSETRHLIAADELARMKPGALLINCARGGLVNETDLLAALEQGRLGGAGFDVLESEPPQNGSALLDSKLPQLLVTPHIAWASQPAMIRLAQQVVDNISAFVGGEMRNRVV